MNTSNTRPLEASVSRFTDKAHTGKGLATKAARKASKKLRDLRKNKHSIWVI